MTITLRKPVFNHPAVDFRAPAAPTAPIWQAPSYMQMRRPAQSKAGQA